jgi:hypothetical protein
MNFYTLNGRSRWGILPVFHLRLTFKNGAQEVMRVYDFQREGQTAKWIKAKGQGFFTFDLSNVIAINNFKTTYRLGIAKELPDRWRENKRRK